MVQDSIIAQTIINLEKSALDRWGKGDPSGCLETLRPEDTYFDPFLDHRITGLAELTRYYEGTPRENKHRPLRADQSRC